jgi:hypothetical protein
MGLAKMGLSFAVLAVAGVAYMAPERTIGVSRSAAPEAGETATASATYQVLRAGHETGCFVSKGRQLSNDKAELEFGRDCADSVGGFAEARYWTDEPDGSVAFMDADGSIALRLAASDGLAFEAYGAGAPLIALAAASY